MHFEHKPISKAEIETALEEANRTGRYIGRNPDAARLFDFIASAGGFNGEKSTKGISRLAYAYEPSERQRHHEPKKDTEVFDYGYRRWENLRRGDKHFTPREAEFVHAALVRAAGYEWGQAFAPEELVTVPFHDFLMKALTLGLPWPEGKIPPSMAMEIVWLAQKDRSLTIRPANPSATRLGGNKSSSNKSLQSTCSLPRHMPEETYVLQVRGVEAGAERIFVFEASQENLAFDGGNETFCGFPIRLLKPKSVNLTLKSEDDAPFEFYDIKGSFCFFAVGFPADWDFQTAFKADPRAERWSRDEFETFIRSVRRLQHEKPSEVRVGWYGYKVE